MHKNQHSQKRPMGSTDGPQCIETMISPHQSPQVQKAHTPAAAVQLYIETESY